MRAADIVVQFFNKLPQLTDAFSDSLSVTSVVRAGTVLTVTTASAHGLSVNSAVSLVGALTPISLTALDRSGAVGTLVTATRHDITEPVESNPDTRTTVVLSGSTEAEFNGEFEILTVPNRKTITFVMTDSGPVTATGAPIIENGSSSLQTLAKLYTVDSVPSNTTFTVTEADTALPDPVGTITASLNTRVSMSAHPDRLDAVYTAVTLGQKTEKKWAFVVLGDPFASKDRSLSNDATSNLGAGDEYRQQVIFPFSVFVYFPTTSEIAAATARDEAADLLTTLCQCVLGQEFNTRTALALQGAVNYTDDNFVDFNSAFYVHQYNFAQVSDLIFEDTVGPSVDVAFRDLDFDVFTQLDIEDPLSTSGTTNTIDLDDVDLP
jgi:hypothetical protein